MHGTRKFLSYVKSLGKPVIFCGDLNVAHEEIDIKNSATNKTTKTRPGNAGFTDKERERFSDFC
jgi:exodeoxyribonuclease-3